VVACVPYAATTKEAHNERGAGRFHPLQGPPPRRWTKRGQQSKGRNRVGVTTQRPLAVTADFHGVERLLSAGNTADITLADELTAEVFGCYVVEDRGYDSDRHRAVFQ
jgi:hypothetical protein